MASADLEDQTAAPAILVIASGPRPASLLLPPNADLGRKIVAGGKTHEIDDERMSREHATVRWERGVWVVVDLDSRNGTFVDGDRIYGETRRRGEAVLRLGHTVCVLLADAHGHPVADGAPGPELQRAYDQIRGLASGDTLLIQGETGTGKEVAARLFHEASPRRAGPFVAVSCAAIPEMMGERLLFGGTKRAPDQAPIATIGHVQMARGGTLYLDDVAELDDRAQAALAGALARGDLGIGLVASGSHLRAAVADGLLREDLHAQLARAAVQLPTLRTRRVDIARTIQHELAARKLGAHARLLEGCLIRPWPGNATELRTAIRRAAATALEDGRELVRIDDLPENAGVAAGTPSAETAVERSKPNAERLDRAALLEALHRANGIVSAAARTLGLHRTELYRLLEQHGIAHDD